MGILDQAKGALSGMSGTGSQNQLLSVVLGMLNDQKSGGLSGLLDRFQQNGLGEQVSSWIGPGQNQPVSDEQIDETLGHDKVEQIAQQAGISHEQASGGIAELLPNLIDKLTPEGKVPDQSSLALNLGSLTGKLGSH
jgi:uncharacterized protein YidB (DUF937 family)